ncbi:hypothetical protein H257_09221 [Aphanomyces astaci]|uniref:Uncharacterized protein n=1 Tax=Aphanomyces astaci TaxID=112090 RepID=W4GBU6_APHAT|nr:hypothetical protein H257_09221 [Aphanomyces astaci]ETV76761.1 hypothetical protein H257_09221 [Aphanomyces astaci]|eukprot:XP_009833673.1 hypothetical protein H257_09221 [Aphanomyces astaci]
MEWGGRDAAGAGDGRRAGDGCKGDGAGEGGDGAWWRLRRWHVMHGHPQRRGVGCYREYFDCWCLGCAEIDRLLICGPADCGLAEDNECVWVSGHDRGRCYRRRHDDGKLRDVEHGRLEWHVKKSTCGHHIF